MNVTLRLTSRHAHSLLALFCALAIAPGDALSYGLSGPAPGAQVPPQAAASRIPSDQLDSLVAPVALYPDPMLAQLLAASTYPLELTQLQQFLIKHPGLKDQALLDAVSMQPWDPTVQAMAGLPDVVKRLTDDIQWTTDLGNAFLAQEGDVMNAVQRMRAKAEMNGALKSTEQLKVETTSVDNRQVIVIEQANPQMIYVPSYDPVVVYGPPVYPYPRIYYPSVAGAAISFGAGVAMGAFWGGGWGWNAGWGHNNISINNNNHFNRNVNVTGNRAGNVNGTWQHRAAPRGATPYAGTTRAGAAGAARSGAAATAGTTRAGAAGAARNGAVGTTGTTRAGAAGAARNGAAGTTGTTRAGAAGAAGSGKAGTAGANRAAGAGAARSGAVGTTGTNRAGGAGAARSGGGAQSGGNAGGGGARSHGGGGGGGRRR